MKTTLRMCCAAFMLAAGFFLTGLQAFASHIEGTDISCVKVGPYSYLVTLKLYRDCSGINVSPAVVIETRAVGCPGNQYAFDTLTLGGAGVEVSDVAAGQATSCSTPPDNTVHGVQEYTYSGLVTVPASACATDWQFSYTDYARNPTVNLYQFGSSLYFYTKAEVMVDTAVMNNSPVYSANPVPYVCVNDTVTYMAQATDPDGDSLVFSLRAAMGSSGLPLYYNPGYSGAQPFGAASPLLLDPATGYMKVIPTMLGNYVVVLQVDEYRSLNGQMVRVGSSQRDVQYHVVQCNTVLPRLSGNLQVNTGSGSQAVVPGATVRIMAGQPATITLPTYSASPGVVLTISSNAANEIPGATFTSVQNSTFPDGVFSWTPTAQHARTAPYVFSYHIRDNAAPYPNEVYGLVRVQVSNVLSAAAPEAAPLQVPNVISPSGGQLSRYFAVPGAAAGDYALAIYDQLGRLVYRSAAYHNRWDGSQAAAGLYVYRLQNNHTGAVHQGQLAVIK